MSLAALNAAPLKTADGQEVTAGSLWADGPAVVLVVRRPGCVLCRAEALKVWERREEFLPARLVCVVHEWRPAEIKAFVNEGYWPGPLYHDLNKEFYKVIGGGQLKKGTAMGLLNPFGDVWKRIHAANKLVASHNVVGEGLIMGGLMVVGAGGQELFFLHVETDLGVHAEHAEVVEAAQKAVAAQQQQQAGSKAPALGANPTAVMAQ